MVRYVAMPSPKKPWQALDADPVLWARSGTHPAVEDCCHEPVTAKALHQRRLAAVRQAAEAGENDPALTDMDVWALVVRTGIRNSPDNRSAHLSLVQFAKEHVGAAMVHYLWKKRVQLPQIIDDIWVWENVAEAAAAAARSRADALKFAAAQPCTCKGQWVSYVVASMMANGINMPELCHTVLDALLRGRSPTTPVVVLAGKQGGEGKSVFLKPLHTIFEELVFVITKGAGNFPFLSLLGAKVAYLDDFRFDQEVLSWATQCLWFDGSPLPVGRPQNVAGSSGNVVYKGTAPIFVTTKLADLKWLEDNAQINIATGLPWDTDAAMILRRLKVYRFEQKMPKPAANFDFCGSCFARFLHGQSAAWCAHA